MKRGTYKILVGMVGWAVMLLGLVMIPYPGPGWLVVFLGLSILAREFTWAARMELYGKGKYKLWESWIMRQPLYIKLLLGILTTLTVVITIWLLNGYGLMNDWFNLGQDWLISPLFD